MLNHFFLVNSKSDEIPQSIHCQFLFNFSFHLSLHYSPSSLTSQREAKEERRKGKEKRERKEKFMRTELFSLTLDKRFMWKKSRENVINIFAVSN